MGSVVNPAILPTPLVSFGPEMGLKERVLNTLMFAYLNFYHYCLLGPYMDNATKELLNTEEDIDLLSIYRSAAFLLRSSHPVFEDNCPENPNTARVAGMQTRPAETIKDPEVKKWLDEAENGVVYVSFGSVC